MYILPISLSKNKKVPRRNATIRPGVAPPIFYTAAFPTSRNIINHILGPPGRVIPRRTAACGPRAFTRERADRAMPHACRKLRRSKRREGATKCVPPSRSHGVTHHLARPCKRTRGVGKGRWGRGHEPLSVCGEGCAPHQPPLPSSLLQWGPFLYGREKRGKRPRCVRAMHAYVLSPPPHFSHSLLFLCPVPLVTYVPPESIAFH